MARLEGKEDLIRLHRERADKLVRALALETVGRLVDKTPVDTGRAQANWNVATGAPSVRNIPDGQYGRSELSILRALGKASSIRAGDVIYVTNALPYIPALERGSSTQAPQGMIGVTIREIKPWIRREVARLERSG